MAVNILYYFRTKITQSTLCLETIVAGRFTIISVYRAYCEFGYYLLCRWYRISKCLVNDNHNTEKRRAIFHFFSTWRFKEKVILISKAFHSLRHEYSKPSIIDQEDTGKSWWMSVVAIFDIQLLRAEAVAVFLYLLHG